VQFIKTALNGIPLTELKVLRPISIQKFCEFDLDRRGLNYSLDIYQKLVHQNLSETFNLKDEFSLYILL